MEKVYIAGTGMTHFTKSPGRGVRSLAGAATGEALEASGIPIADIEQVFFGNAAAGSIDGQEMIRGEVALRGSELWGKPVINVENACASGGSALNLGWQAVAGGFADAVLVIGAEQLSHEDKTRAFTALLGSTDVDDIPAPNGDGPATNSILMEFYAQEAAEYLQSSGATPDDLARVAVKNRTNASHNPRAQYRELQTVEDVLGGRMIVPPLTLAMCSPITDGGAAVILCSDNYAARLRSPRIEVLASAVAGGAGKGSSPVADVAAKVYNAASLGPDDLDLVELHDAAAPAELIQYSEIGLCDEGDGYHLMRAGDTEIGGRIPANTSGGLLSRGHPLGATGLAQIVELCEQLQERADGRQVDGARTAMAVNSGGWVNGTYAVTVASILQRVS
jgi:acetyl-CoA acyltransferase